MMQDIAHPAEPINGSQTSPMIVIIDDQVLVRTCIVNILKRELRGFEIVEMTTTSGLGCLSERDVRLIAFGIEDKKITDPSVEDCIALLEESFPNVLIAVLSNRDDEATVSAAMRRGVRGFFSTSIAFEVALAGLRLILAGGVYRPLPIVRQSEAANVKVLSESSHASEPCIVHKPNGDASIMPEPTMADLTPREQHVLAALKLGLPNKLIAVRLNLSENTVKMHIQRIMRKCCARNRTEAVIRWSGRSNGDAPSA
jgi:DNA-binding NarL/FixJ family response regulator